MTSTRTTGALLVCAVLAMVAAAAVAVPSGLTLNPADPAAALSAVRDRTGAHLAELALDVLGWLALTTAGLCMAVRGPLVPAGLLTAAGLAGLLHDAGNLALTQLAAMPTGPATAAAVMLTAKWTVNLAGLLWVAATAGLAHHTGFRRTGLLAAVSGLAAVVLPWTTGTAGPSPALEQVGYLLHLPVMVWFGVLGVRLCQRSHSAAGAFSGTAGARGGTGAIRS